MSHARPLPEAATAPYPPHPEPRPVPPAAPEPAAKTPAEPGSDARTARWIATGAAIGVGSAAIVAAALYAGRQTKRP